MLFVTVGTHEQPFDRLIQEVDRLKEQGWIEECVIMQTGFCNYIPKSCVHRDWYSYQDMEYYMRKARLVICHGGTGSIVQALSYGKAPIVVPRLPCYGEHVNDHQLRFVEYISGQLGIQYATDIRDLKDMLFSGNSNRSVYKSNTANFNLKFERMVDAL